MQKSTSGSAEQREETENPLQLSPFPAALCAVLEPAFRPPGVRSGVKPGRLRGNSMAKW